MEGAVGGGGCGLGWATVTRPGPALPQVGVVISAFFGKRHRFVSGMAGFRPTQSCQVLELRSLSLSGNERET